MLRDERDYLLRMIAAAAAIAARLRERLVGGGSADEIVREARQAQNELLGKDAPLFRALDPASIAKLVADKKRIEAWAELMRVEAEALRAAGKPDEAAALDARASALRASSAT